MTAFGNINDSLSFFRNNYDAFAAFRAAIIRLHGLVDANEQGRAAARRWPPRRATTASVELDGIEVRTPTGEQLINPLDLQLEPGRLAGDHRARRASARPRCCAAWPNCGRSPRARCAAPSGDNETMFLSQLPYVPLGDLRGVVSYPNAPGDISDDTLRDALDQGGAGRRWCDRLDEEEDWAKVLSPGEQQRIAFARILLTKPKAVFLDEATSALDPGLEFALYQLMRTELPDCVVVSVSHRPTVEQHHESTCSNCSAKAASGGWAGSKGSRRGSSRRVRCRVRSGAAPEERPLTQLRAAGVSLAVLGDVGRARPDRVQPGDDAAVVALHLAVDGDSPGRRW